MAMENISLIATAGFLVYASVVNLNDPDAWFWSTAYGVGALLTLVSMIRRKKNNWFFFIARQVSLVGSAVFLVFSLHLIVAQSKLTFQYSGKSGWLGILELELMREGCGALILALSLCRSSSRMKNVKARDDENPSYWQQHTSTTDKILWSSVTVIALVGIGLGMFLPWYFNRLGGIAIPAHCGGA